jgi:hypothetical protein
MRCRHPGETDATDVCVGCVSIPQQVACRVGCAKPHAASAASELCARRKAGNADRFKGVAEDRVAEDDLDGWKLTGLTDPAS